MGGKGGGGGGEGGCCGGGDGGEGEGGALAEALGYEAGDEGEDGEEEDGGVEEVVGGCHRGRRMADTEASDGGVYVRQHGTNAMKGVGRFQDACLVYLCFSHCACTMPGTKLLELESRFLKHPYHSMVPLPT